MALRFILTTLPTLAIAGRIESGFCPADVNSLIHSPFKPYFRWWTKSDVQACWGAADCLFEAAGESRKQQFAATALIMGLVPLTLKDIAWPERRIIYVTDTLNPIVEILVLALGLVPVETGTSEETKKRIGGINTMAEAAWDQTRFVTGLWVALSAVVMLASYAGLAVMEIYSKRSALGCPYPVFVATWYVVALVPAAIHMVFAGLRRRKIKSEKDPERKRSIISAVQGADEAWPVQLAWGIYYIAGTLVFTSIMAVTVIELVVWVGLGLAVTGSSKLLAFFLCLVFERRGVEVEPGRRGEREA
ncbi:uncharacterized protein BDR25DRAFT_280577 [Lindgomyces ingoldianus]|uniref:Uncharacterized protein n=1 Tax=Lindgomyces ingoldianus TaxID=673940 RepID=A0ACB6R6M2_9PLEO|nr:uncharacterized protein BDR25DRAFT_280577 [Lindgomyces ingoldianus]KAF2474948.1 hypothetical protein BDR25DRAFT_280577 [Lindgomyces ingoldianus]